MSCPNEHKYEVRFVEQDDGIHVDVSFVLADFPFPEISVSIGGIDHPLEYTGEAVEIVQDPIRDRVLYWIRTRGGNSK
jgi:hypothetical protein